MTIYEKESLFESVEDQFCSLKTYLEEAISREEIHVVEGEVFRQLQRIGLGLLEAFVALSGTGYESGIALFTEDGRPMKYKGIKKEASPYLSIFGELRIYRASYAHPDGGRVVTIHSF